MTECTQEYVHVHWSSLCTMSVCIKKAEKDDSKLTKPFRSIVKEKKDEALPHKGAGDLLRVISLSMSVCVCGGGGRRRDLKHNYQTNLL
jgi:hypothetical protein